jgi:membrane protease YdiL (CAAX protease family)
MEEIRIQKAYAISPAAPYQAALIFAATSLFFFASLYLILPLLRERNVSWFTCFNLVLALPMFLLVGFAISACAIEGPLHWPSLRDRFRLGRMGTSSWFWTVALAVFMFGGRFANPIAFSVVLIAIGTDRYLTRQQRWKFAVGVAAFLVMAWMLWQTRAYFTRIPLHAFPQTLRQFLAHLTAADSFMGLPLKGQWWIAIYYAFVLLFGNVAGEELWWRGYLLPRQELASGSIAWVYHGMFWAGFHLFFQATAWDLIHMVPTCCALAFVAQHRKSTWPGIVAHTVGNMGVMLGIFQGVLM